MSTIDYHNNTADIFNITAGTVPVVYFSNNNFQQLCHIPITTAFVLAVWPTTNKIWLFTFWNVWPTITISLADLISNLSLSVLFHCLWLCPGKWFQFYARFLASYLVFTCLVDFRFDFCWKTADRVSGPTVSSTRLSTHILSKSTSDVAWKSCFSRDRIRVRDSRIWLLGAMKWRLTDGHHFTPARWWLGRFCETSLWDAVSEQIL